MEQSELARILEAILFAAGEPVPVERLCLATECDPDEIHACMKELSDSFAFDRRGVRIVRLENAYQMCSAGEMSGYITKALETRKPPKLSASQLETLTIVAYYQPATKAYVEQLRGVDSSYSIGALLTKKLIEECGKLNVPGRPNLYRTTPDFLRVFGLQSLDELPKIETMQFGDRTAVEEEAKKQMEEKQFAEQTTQENADGQQVMEA